MKSLKRRFDQIAEKHRDWGTIICFNTAIMGQKFSSTTMRIWFNKLVDKNDYSKNDQKEIYAFLDKLTNMAEDRAKSGQIGSRTNYLEYFG